MIVEDIRNVFKDKYQRQEFTVDKSGVKTIEVIGASFVADDDIIFGTPNTDYIQREIQWYMNKSLNVNDIPGKVPEIWKSVATPAGQINSNYGYLIFSEENGFQYNHVLNKLIESFNTRQATMIYTRPTMHTDSIRGGMKDFVCTNAVQYLVRENRLDAIVQMRSNDIWAGYRNDYAWQRHVQNMLVADINSILYQPSGKIVPGIITWQVGSLHAYEKQFYLIDHYSKTGKCYISKQDYDVLYHK